MRTRARPPRDKGRTISTKLIGPAAFGAPRRAQGPVRLAPSRGPLRAALALDAALVAALAALALLAAFGAPGLALAAPAQVATAAGPHGGATIDSDSCRLCHRLHDSSAVNQSPIAGGSESELCLACHDDAALGADASIDTAADTFAGGSHHALEDAPTAADLTNTCGSCHNPHLDPARHPKLIRASVNGTATAGQDLTSLCLDCHDDTPEWRGRGYDPKHPQRDERGFPVKGAFPGKAAYRDRKRNPHSAIPTDSPYVAASLVASSAASLVTSSAAPATAGAPSAAGVDATSSTGPAASSAPTVAAAPASPRFEETGGDCRNCHGVHGGPNRYDLLTSTFRPTTSDTLETDLATGDEAALCFRCHSGDDYWLDAGAADIRSRYTTTSTDPEVFAGHRVATFGGQRPARSPLLCADCHNPHGSGRGNSAMIGDDVGSGLDLDEPAGVRAFCLSCHTAQDGRVWDSDIEGYRAVSPSETVVGLRRDGTLSEGQRSADSTGTTNWLVLSPLADAHASTDVESCYACHGGGDWGTDTGNDVHNPSLRGFSDPLRDAEIKPCYDCHDGYQRYMEDGHGSRTGDSRTDVYHHVLGGSRGDGDISSASGYPTGTAEVYCTSCHRGHTGSVETTPTQVRSNIGTRTAATSDYSGSAPFGICVSCHAVSRSKDTAGQKSEGTTATAAITGGSAAGGYGAGAHSYQSPITLKSGARFGLDCGKCHGGTVSATDEPSSTVTTHWSDDRHLLAGLGTTVVDPVKEILCFRCHATVGDRPNGAAKPRAGRDYYDAAAMSAASESVFRSFTLASRHPVAGSPTGNVTCSNCHNPHSTSAGGAVSDPANTYEPAPFSTAFDRTRFCLGCHSGTTPSAKTDARVWVPTSVVIASADAALMNKGANFTRGHSSANGSITSVKVIACDDCHDKHGSNAPRLLGRFNPASGRNTIGATTITANDATVCYACHTGATSDTQATDAEGYPTDGRWPGRAVYTGAYGMHNSSSVQRPGSSAAPGDCKNCHDVHGTSSPYDELVGSPYTPTYFGFCFDCHGPGNPKGFNQQPYFPVSAGGTSTRPNAGHATRTDGIRPAGSPMPCYDCHNNHGSGSEFGLEVHSPLSATRSVIVGDDPGEIKVSSAAGVRAFCFTCHTTSDTAQGWDGSAMVTVSSGAKIEGIDRVATSARLRLPSKVYAHRRSATSNCETNNCHGRNYTSGGNNVHSPRTP